MYSKQEIRDTVKERIAGIDEKKRKEASQNTRDQLIQILKNIEPGILVTYNPLSDEVDVSEVTPWFEKFGKIITIGHDGSHEEIPSDKKIVMLVPGRAFTLEGVRIGRGSGYYDQFLEQFPGVYAIGVCFECQIFEELPEEAWDKRMSEVVFG